MKLDGNAPTLSTLDRDLLCRYCGYNLRGLSHDGRCPECGLPVPQSAHCAGWRAIDDPTLRRIRVGAIICVGDVLLAFVSMIALLVVRHHIAGVAWEILFWISFCSPPAIFAAGIWKITTRFNDDERHLAAGFVARICVLTLLAGLFVFVAAVVSDSSEAVFMGAVALEIAASAIIGHMALLSHLLYLGRHVSNEALIQAARFLRRSFGFSSGGLIAACFLKLFSGSFAVLCIALAAIVALLVFSILMLAIFSLIAGEIGDELWLSASRARSKLGQPAA